jgi:hypothetical protein
MMYRPVLTDQQKANEEPNEFGNKMCHCLQQRIFCKGFLGQVGDLDLDDQQSNGNSEYCIAEKYQSFQLKLFPEFIMKIAHKRPMVPEITLKMPLKH